MKYESVVGRNTKLTTEEVREYIESFGYKLLSEYINSKIKITVQCPNGHESYDVKWGNFKTGKRCPKCKSEKLSNHFRKNIEEVQKIIDVVGYKWIDGEYVNLKSKLTFECPQGHRYKTSFSVFQQGYRCPHCYGNAKLEYHFIKSQIEKENYILLSKEYNNSQEKLNIVCDNGHKFSMNWNKFQIGERCPHCNISKGARKIEDVLKNKNINYVKEYKFDDCINIKHLPFDFYIESLNILIEFDGEQHYKIGCFGKDLLNLMNIKYRDNIKDVYCKENSIRLIRIPYWEINNIDKILKDL